MVLKKNLSPVWIGQGRLTEVAYRQQQIGLVQEAVANGARQTKACALLGLN